MRFDNAFLTCENKVGMQFFHKGTILTIYPDHKDQLITSECTEEEKKTLTFLYNRRKGWYKKNAIISSTQH